MERTFSQMQVRPNLPLRRPFTSPAGVPAVPRTLTPPISTTERPLATCNGEVEANSTSMKDGSLMIGSMPPAVTVKLCNYCSQQGNFRCTRCKKTCYCSVACQSEDWNAHRHMCKPITLDTPASEKTKENPDAALPQVGSSPNPAEPTKVQHSDVTHPQRVYRRDLGRNDFTKGAQLQACVVELQSPGRFFIQVQSPELTETLRSITVELQKTYGNSLGTTYLPDIGEVCVVKYSLDQNWYRGVVQSLSADQKTANVLYIDFGNEEDVTLERIKPLVAKIKLIPPCALECRVAGVTALTDSWTGECCIAVRQLVAGKSLTFTLVEASEFDHTYAVDIALTTIGKQLSTFLLDQDYAMKEVITKKHTEEDIDSLVSASLENFRRSGGKEENREARTPDSLTQGLGDSFSAMVTHLQTPHDIICQKLDNARVIQELQLKLWEHCSKAPANENFRPAPGTVCCSLFSEDSQWYRAKVLAYSSEERVCVGYIDFGNSEEVELSRLRPLSPELLVLPMQAIPCALAGVRPMTAVWSEDCVQLLRQMVCNRFLRVEILGKREGTALVAMMDESSDPQANVAELLISCGHALPADIDAQGTPEAPAEEPQVAVPAVSEKLVWSCVEPPCGGQTVALVVSVMENPGEFYCYIYNPEDLQVLVELGAELKQHCEANSAPFSPKVGEPCCALFSDDRAWYRGMVQGVWVEGKARVYFVDYGNSSEVESSHLRAITPGLLKHPFQAIRCWLAGVELLGPQWSSQAIQRFQALCFGQKLQGRVLSITERGYGVELESSGVDVAATLLSEQLVKAPSTPKPPPTKTPVTPTTPQTPSTPKPPQLQPPVQRETPATTVVEPPKPTAAGQKEAPVKPEAPVQREAGSEQQAIAAAVTGTEATAAAFPLDWRTVELPPNETFQPHIAAVVSPSLFYLLNPSQVDVQQLQRVMMELAVYCTNQTFPSQCKPMPGAACCARFSSDKKWYRAVVLETTETGVSVIYADYGNLEEVPYSSVLPIPSGLLQLPFHIARCALTGKEHFPAVWPREVLVLFGALLSDRVVASVQAFDGKFNLLSVTMPTERGSGQLNAMILEGLPGAQAKLKTITPAPARPEPDRAMTIPTAGPVNTPGQNQATEQVKPAPAPGNDEAAQKMSGPKEPQSITHSKSINGPHNSCCCLDLKIKIDQLEEHILSLMKLIGGISK